MSFNGYHRTPRFPEQFVVYAECGTLRTRHIADTVTDCQAWGWMMRQDGWTIGEPKPYFGDNVRPLLRPETDEGSAA